MQTREIYPPNLTWQKYFHGGKLSEMEFVPVYFESYDSGDIDKESTSSSQRCAEESIKDSLQVEKLYEAGYTEWKISFFTGLPGHDEMNS